MQLACASKDVLKGAIEAEKHPHYPDALFAKVQARLYRSKDFGPWEEMARFTRETQNGRVGRIVPLADGSFLAIGSFQEGDFRSPLARYHRDSTGTLVFVELLSLDDSGEAPASAKVDDHGQEKLAWRPGCELRNGIGGVAKVQAGLVLFTYKGLMLLDSRSGAFLRKVAFPEGYSASAFQPTREGKILVKARFINEQLQSAKRHQAPKDHPLDKLISARFGHILHHNDRWGKEMLCWNPESGELTQRTLPYKIASFSIHGDFIVNKDGVPLGKTPGRPGLHTRSPGRPRAPGSRQGNHQHRCIDSSPRTDPSQQTQSR